MDVEECRLLVIYLTTKEIDLLDTDASPKNEASPYKKTPSLRPSPEHTDYQGLDSFKSETFASVYTCGTDSAPVRLLLAYMLSISFLSTFLAGFGFRSMTNSEILENSHLLSPIMHRNRPCIPGLSGLFSRPIQFPPSV